MRNRSSLPGMNEQGKIDEVRGSLPMVDGIPIDNNNNNIKRGHSCCGGCCDYRRAVIILNIISLTFKVISMMFIGTVGGVSHIASSTIHQLTYDDDALNDMKSQLQPKLDETFGVVNTWIGYAILVQFLDIVIVGLALYGAVKFNKHLVTINAVFLIGRIILMYPIMFFMILNGLILYPHIMLILYIHNGIMSEENYPNERQSCCCLPPQERYIVVSQAVDVEMPVAVS